MMNIMFEIMYSMRKNSGLMKRGTFQNKEFILQRFNCSDLIIFNETVIQVSICSRSSASVCKKSRTSPPCPAFITARLMRAVRGAEKQPQSV